ncbi:hypothetical protein [Mucilaginibacter paludis]|uniref:hypothetical protein n=1 Tax=Mucilaginibacter paludis TaxID=423351 RepID=UPI0001E9D8AC|nr:hypothetical protein [Mucilaginibacter paludis]
MIKQFLKATLLLTCMAYVPKVYKQVPDLQRGVELSAALNDVSPIPRSFLVGPDGKIIAKNLRGEKLQEKLASIVKISNL